MAKKEKLNISKAIKRPGDLTKKAKKEGLSLLAYSEKYKGENTLRGRQSRFYLTLRKINKKRKG